MDSLGSVSWKTDFIFKSLKGWGPQAHSRSMIYTKLGLSWLHLSWITQSGRQTTKRQALG